MDDLNVELTALSVLKFQDFVPEQKKASMWTGKRSHESLAIALKAANEWMLAHPEADILNVETVALPNIHQKYEEGSVDPDLKVVGSGFDYWHQFIRIWYLER
jgi:hypothetical protein